MSETDWTDHPDHDVGEAGDPDGGGEEGDHEPSLPAPLGTVGHGEEQKQGQRPHGQPLQLVTHPSWREKEKEGMTEATMASVIALITNIY